MSAARSALAAGPVFIGAGVLAATLSFVVPSLLRVAADGGTLELVRLVGIAAGVVLVIVGVGLVVIVPRVSALDDVAASLGEGAVIAFATRTSALVDAIASLGAEDELGAGFHAEQLSGIVGVGLAPRGVEFASVASRSARTFMRIPWQQVLSMRAVGSGHRRASLEMRVRIGDRIALVPLSLVDPRTLRRRSTRASSEFVDAAGRLRAAAVTSPSWSRNGDAWRSARRWLDQQIPDEGVAGESREGLVDELLDVITHAPTGSDAAREVAVVLAEVLGTDVRERVALRIVDLVASVRDVNPH